MGQPLKEKRNGVVGEHVEIADRAKRGVKKKG